MHVPLLVRSWKGVFLAAVLGATAVRRVTSVCSPCWPGTRFEGPKNGYASMLGYGVLLGDDVLRLGCQKHGCPTGLPDGAFLIMLRAFLIPVRAFLIPVRAFYGPFGAFLRPKRAFFKSMVYA